MSELIAVTNRHLCCGDFLARIEALAAARPRAILLREKDLPEREYRALAEQALCICTAHRTRCILHSFADTAAALNAEALHLPLPVLRKLSAAKRARFSVLGASCHSVEDAQEAETLGCTYLTAGHIFATDCKRGLPGRGLEFLRAVCTAVSIPVYAIGGMAPENFAAVRQAGAAGACAMSSAMQCRDPAAYFAAFEETDYEIL